MACIAGILKLDNTCDQTCLTGNCDLPTIQRICGNNTRVNKTNNLYTCLCDWAAGAILAFDGQSCITMAKCYTIGGTPILATGGTVDGDGKQVCGCGGGVNTYNFIATTVANVGSTTTSYPYNPVTFTCSQVANTSLRCPV